MGFRARGARIAQGFSQDDVGEYCNINRDIISNFENGKSGVSMATFKDLCKCLNTSADFLMFGKVERNTPMENLIQNLTPYQKEMALELLRIFVQTIDHK